MREGINVALRELVERIGAKLLGDHELSVRGVATLEHAQPGALSFLGHKKYRRYLANTKATAVILTEDQVPICPVASVVHEDPYLAHALAMRIIYPVDKVCSGVHSSAVIDPTAVVDATAWVGALTIIGAHTRIGARAFIGPACVVESHCVIGEDSRLVAHVTLCKETQVGCRVVIQPGAVLGSDGFGFARDGTRWLHVPQIGRVCIGDDVEIGANTTIDRGSLDDTCIANGAILDNLIQIGHNVQIGERTAVVACTGISGSTKIGKDCLIGGDVGIAGHLDIGDKVYLSAGSKVTRNLHGPCHYGGVLPVDPDPLWRKNVARVRHLDELVRRVRQLERLIEDTT